jgi:hypothetical protein
MGCAGSKPHLPSLKNSHHNQHLNSPQKGFIVFDAKTIQYLIANESEIKSKLIKRCEGKLIKTISQSCSSKSLLSNSKRTNLVSTSSNSENNDKTNSNQDIKDLTTGANKSNMSLANSILSQQTIGNEYKQKEFSIYSAVDYVLKYAINDFDIENFKSSNHLSMKQIRKDIMKKYNSSSRQFSSSKLNSSVSNGYNLSTFSSNSKSSTLNTRESNAFKCMQSNA